MNKKLLILSLSVLVSFGVAVFVRYTYNNQANKTNEVVSKLGSRGETVKKIQKKLKEGGYYKGKVDGIYGTKTKNAVKAFQKSKGLKVDGIVGSKTLAKLGISTSTASKTNYTNNSSNVNLLARVINGEARGEPYKGQVAVGAVILNRVKSSQFPSTIAGVIYQPGAFDAVSDGQINLTPKQSCINAAKDALNGFDPTNGCIYYYNPKTATNKWIRSRKISVTIGKHVFAY